ncbi:MAG: ATP-dependent sacrificial sulfur transferase LarE [Actinobacteria bacterium]|nr:ATP-dependent sacrificial sulfur transferase LarE [Actinomycetota bacterium]
MDKLLKEKIIKLKKYLQSLESAVIAFSGGTDSTFLLKITSEILKDNLAAITAKSPTFPDSEFEDSKNLARGLNVRHIIIATNELDNTEFTVNDKDRCYYCKNELLGLISDFARKNGFKHILDGSNYDDMKDYRPGARASKKWDVLSPLKEAGLTKKEIRTVSKELGLPTWDKPAAACLASRIPYGTKITEELLKKITGAESVLKKLGFAQVRVRHHDNIARIEIPVSDMPGLLDGKIKNQIIKSLKDLGYLYVVLDIEGYTTGSMNKALDINKK